MSHSKARLHLEKALALDPAHLPARIALAQLHRRESRDSDAERVLTEIISTADDATSARLALAELLLDAEREDEALEHLQVAVTLDPESAAAHQQLADLMASNGRVKEAADHLSRLVEIQPLDGEAHFRLAELLEHPDDFDRAKLLLEIAGDLMPADPRPPHLLGQLLERGEKTDRDGSLLHEPDLPAARRLYERTLSLAPRHASTRLALGALLEQADEAKTAREHYQLAAESPREHLVGEACLRLGRLDKQTDPEAALRFLDQAVRIQTSRARALALRAELHLAKHRSQEAAKDFQAALQAFAEEERRLREQSEEAADLGNFARARRILKRADAARQAVAPPLRNLARLANEQGDPQEALRLLDKAAAAHPAYIDARYDLAQLLEILNRPEEARGQYEAVVHGEWAHPEAHFRLGEYALADGDRQKAEMHFLIVTDLKPRHKKALARLKELGAGGLPAAQSKTS